MPLPPKNPQQDGDARRTGPDPFHKLPAVLRLLQDWRTCTHAGLFLLLPFFLWGS